MSILEGGRLVDPDGGGDRRRAGWVVDEALRPGPVGGQQDFGTPVAGLLGESVLHRRRSHQADARVAMLVVVPVEECPAEETGVFDRLEASRELRVGT